MIRIQQDDFDPGAELASLSQGRLDIGGIGCFVGLVRGCDDETPGSAIYALRLEHYPAMALRQLQALEAQAHRRWPLLATALIHRYGRLQVGERIVLILAASQHRQPALEATAFMIDWLKTKAPFWKLQETDRGDRWVLPKAADEDASNRWRVS